jgi:8-oxo-dGTP pyrophosphatase MutT (NUDIX family)
MGETKNPAADPDNTPDFIGRLEAGLGRPRPGLQAQLDMLPEPRPGHQTYEEVEDISLKAAILLLVYPLEGRPHLLFTRRTEKVLHHPRQISFPGGHREPGETVVETALREAEEEVGVRPGDVRILGELTPLYIPPSNYCVYPVVGTVDIRPDFRLAPLEVAEILEVPLDLLLAPESRCREMWNVGGLEMTVPHFAFKGDKIWGATAMVLAEFLHILKDGGT